GAQGNDVFQLTGTAPGAFTALVSSAPQVLVAGLGTALSTVNLNGAGGSDSFIITQVAGWGIANINITGNGNDSVTLIGTATDDVYTYTPLSANSGMIADSAGASTTTYSLFGVGALSIDALGQAGADSLT